MKIIQNEITLYKHNYIQKNTPNTLALLLRLTQPIDNFLTKPTYETLKTKKVESLYDIGVQLVANLFKKEHLTNIPYYQTSA